MLIACADISKIQTILSTLTGQLSISLMANTKDFETYTPFIQSCRDIAGRVVFNAAPTGVEVCQAMHHGGTYPATSDAKSTSVGQDAIKRFVRPIALQSCPEVLLPPELQNENPLQIMRLVNGKYTANEIS